MTEYCLWPSTAGPANASGNADSNVTLSVEFYVTAPAWAVRMRLYCGAAFTTSTGLLGLIYRVDSATTGAELARAPFPTIVIGWNEIPLPSPVPLMVNQRYRAAFWEPNGYTATSSYWTTGGAGVNGLTSGVLVAPNGTNATGADQGSYTAGATPTFPVNSFNSTNYWVDVVVNDDNPTAMWSRSAGRRLLR